MVANHHGVHHRIPAPDRITQARRSVVHVVVLLVSAVALGTVLLGALVWTLWILGVVLA
jgi:sterol desaturase/sphingolipid hydroxylase (fatty acid hydroxylase superfamily)